MDGSKLEERKNLTQALEYYESLETRFTFYRDNLNLALAILESILNFLRNQESRVSDDFFASVPELEELIYILFASLISIRIFPKNQAQLESFQF